MASAIWHVSGEGKKWQLLESRSSAIMYVHGYRVWMCVLFIILFFADFSEWLNSEVCSLIVSQDLCAFTEVQWLSKLRQMLLHRTCSEVKALIQLQWLLRQDMKKLASRAGKCFFHSSITYSNNSGLYGLQFSIINTTTVSENTIATCFPPSWEDKERKQTREDSDHQV